MSESTDAGSTAQERLVTALAEMEQWEDVWMELYVRGVTGKRGSSERCPVANYLATKVGETVSVGLNTAATVETMLLWKIPVNVQEFTRVFDVDGYPELESA